MIRGYFNGLIDHQPSEFIQQRTSIREEEKKKLLRMPHHKNLMWNENLPLTFVMGVYKAEGALKHNIFM